MYASRSDSVLCIAATAAIPPRQLPLHDFSTQAITGHHHPITCLATHSSQPLALTAAEAGSAMLWHTQPLTPLGSLAGVLVGSSANNAQSKIVAACWLHTDVHSSSADATVGVLAAASKSRIWLVEVDLVGSSSSSNSSKDMGQNSTTQLLGSADIPDGYQSLESLCTLHQNSQQIADSGYVEHLLVGSLSQRQHPEAQTHAQTESPTQVSGSALGIWQVVMPAGASVAKSGQDQGQSQGQGQGQQPQRQAQLKLLTCNEISQDSAETLTCVVAAAEANFQLMIGTSEGAVRLMKKVDAQSAELTTVKQLRSRGETAVSPDSQLALFKVKDCMQGMLHVQIQDEHGTLAAYVSKSHVVLSSMVHVLLSCIVAYRVRCRHEVMHVY